MSSARKTVASSTPSRKKARQKQESKHPSSESRTRKAPVNKTPMKTTSDVPSKDFLQTSESNPAPVISRRRFSHSKELESKVIKDQLPVDKEEIEIPLTKKEVLARAREKSRSWANDKFLPTPSTKSRTDANAAPTKRGNEKNRFEERDERLASSEEKADVSLMKKEIMAETRKKSRFLADGKMQPTPSYENVRTGQEKSIDARLVAMGHEEVFKRKKGEEKRDRSLSDKGKLPLAKKEILAEARRKSRSWSKGKMSTSSSTKKDSEDIEHKEKMNAIQSEYEDEIKIHLKEIDDLKARIKISITANNEEKLELSNKLAKKNEELANQINNFRQKTANDALTHEKELEELSTSHKESTAAMGRKHKGKIVGLSDEISKLKTSIKNDAAASGKCYDAMKTKLEQKITDLVASHKNEHAKMKTNLEEKITKLITSREKERVARKNDHAEMKSDLDEKIMNLTTSCENECAKMESKLNENLKFQAALERRNADLKKENKELLSRNKLQEEKINAIKSEHEDRIKINLKEIDDLKARIKISITANDEEKLELSKKFTKKIEELANQNNRLRGKTEKLIASHKGITATMDMKHKDQISGLLDEIEKFTAMDRKCKDQISRLSDEIEKLITSHKDITATMERKHKCQISGFSDKIEKLMTSHKDITTVMDRKHKDRISGLSDEISVLKTSIKDDAAACSKCYEAMKTALEEKIIDLVASHKKEHAEMKNNLEEKIMALTNSDEKECVALKNDNEEKMLLPLTKKEILAKARGKSRSWANGQFSPALPATKTHAAKSEANETITIAAECKTKPKKKKDEEKDKKPSSNEEKLESSSTKKDVTAKARDQSRSWASSMISPATSKSRNHANEEDFSCTPLVTRKHEEAIKKRKYEEKHEALPSDERPLSDEKKLESPLTKKEVLARARRKSRSWAGNKFSPPPSATKVHIDKAQANETRVLANECKSEKRKNEDQEKEEILTPAGEKADLPLAKKDILAKAREKSRAWAKDAKKRARESNTGRKDTPAAGREGENEVGTKAKKRRTDCK